MRELMEEETNLKKVVREAGKGLMDLLLCNAVKPSCPSHHVPVHYKDIAHLPQQLQIGWKNACQNELKAVQKRQVYDLVDLPLNCKAIRNRWVFLEKSNGRQCAHLVVKGFFQIEGIDYEEIFSPMIHYETIRLMFALMALKNMYMTGLDVKTTPLYGKLKEEIYMKQPEGFVMKSQPNKVMHLKHALDGLKQASLAWWRELEEFMLTQGFKQASSDAGVFVYRHKDGKIVIALVYIDDTIFLGHDPKLIDRKKCAYLEHWACHDTSDIKEFLGMQINKTAHHVEVNQINYLKQILQQFD